MKISSVPKGLILFHQRTHQFANGGTKPYHTFNYFCKHKYYGDFFPNTNTYKYELIESVPNMIELTREYWWNDLQEDLKLDLDHEYYIVETAMKQYNGIFYDTPLGNEYIFSKNIVNDYVRLISIEMNSDFIPEKEESGSHETDTIEQMFLQKQKNE